MVSKSRKGNSELRYYVFVESVSRSEIEEDNAYARTQYMLDAIQVDAFRSSQRAEDSTEGLSIMRLQTTPRKFGEVSELGTDNVEGKWAAIELGVSSNMPLVWKVDASDSYLGPAKRLNLIKFRLLDDDEAAGLGLTAYCTVTHLKSVPYPGPRRILAPRPGVRVLDVGHASCVAIHKTREVSSDILGYYDVGFPVFFHAKGFPKSFPDVKRVPSSGFVVLSHWDFDHYGLALTILPTLRNLKWYAPAQPVGPNAARLQRMLGTNLNLSSSSPRYIGPNLSVWRGLAPASDRNNSGYVMRVGDAANAILLTGDVGYGYIRSRVKANIAGLGITHHGGNGSSGPPFPLQKNTSIAAVSYGKGNRYKHPSPLRLREHRRAGWIVLKTAAPIRGDRWL